MNLHVANKYFLVQSILYGIHKTDSNNDTDDSEQDYAWEDLLVLLLPRLYLRIKLNKIIVFRPRCGCFMWGDGWAVGARQGSQKLDQSTGPVFKSSQLLASLWCSQPRLQQFSCWPQLRSDESLQTADSLEQITLILLESWPKEGAG